MRWVRGNILSDNPPDEVKWVVPNGTAIGTDLETKYFSYVPEHTITNRHAVVIANQTNAQMLVTFTKKYVVDSAELLVDDFEDAVILADGNTISEYVIPDLFSGYEGIQIDIRANADVTADGYILLVVKEL